MRCLVFLIIIFSHNITQANLLLRYTHTLQSLRAFATQSLNTGQEINTVRKLYLKAGNKRENTAEFINYFKHNKATTNLLRAYHGTALAMQADLEKGIMNKYNRFVEGRDILEEAIQTNPRDAELRYLRFAIQINIPKILGYNNLEEDKNYLLQNIDSIAEIDHKELQGVVYKTLLISELLTEEEEELVTKYMNKN